MAKAVKLPSGNWRVRATATIDGKKITKSFTGVTASKAEKAAEQWQEHCKKVGADSTTMTVREAIEQYITSRSNMLSPTTIRGYKCILRNNMTDLMPLKLYKLTCPIIQNSINLSLETLSPKSIKNIYSLLQHTLKMYYPEFVWSIKFPSKLKADKRVYSHEYIKQIMSAVRGTDFEVETYLGLLSMRESEICGLKWDDIDYQNRLLKICRTKLMNENGEYVIINSTKTMQSRRTVYLPEYVCDILKARQKTSDNAFITHINPNRFRDHLNRILRKSNVEELKFHELRHIYSSLTAALDIDKQIRMTNGGWSNDKIMEGTYQHSLSEAQKSANDKLNAYFSQKVDTKVDTPKPKRLKIQRVWHFS